MKSENYEKKFNISQELNLKFMIRKFKILQEKVFFKLLCDENKTEHLQKIKQIQQDSHLCWKIKIKQIFIVINIFSKHFEAIIHTFTLLNWGFFL